jgi:hypothetical protein
MSDLPKTMANHEVEHLEHQNPSFDAESQKERLPEEKELTKTNKEGITLVPQPSDDPRDPLVSEWYHLV